MAVNNYSKLMVKIEPDDGMQYSKKYGIAQKFVAFIRKNLWTKLTKIVRLRYSRILARILMVVGVSRTDLATHC